MDPRGRAELTSTPDGELSAIAINGTGKHPSDLVAVIVRDPESGGVRILASDHASGAIAEIMPESDLDEAVDEGRARRLAAGVTCRSGWAALTLRGDLRSVIEAWTLPDDAVEPAEARAVSLVGVGGAQAYIGPRDALERARLKWALAVQRACDQHGEAYVVAKRAGEPLVAHGELAKLAKVATLGTYCLPPSQQLCFRLRIAFAQMHGSDVTSFEKTFEYGVSPYVGISRESFSRQVQDLLLSYEVRVAAARGAARAIRPLQPRAMLHADMTGDVASMANRPESGAGQSLRPLVDDG